MFVLNFAGRQQVIVRVSTQPTFTFGNPAPTVPGGLPSTTTLNSWNYDIMPDSQRFLVAGPSSGSGFLATPEIHIVLNWFEELKRLVRAR